LVVFPGRRPSAPTDLEFLFVIFQPPSYESPSYESSMDVFVL
jgi:hypothetical protein